MHVGLLTARFGNELDFPQIVTWAASAGYATIEAHTRHLKPSEVIADRGAATKALLDKSGMRLSSIAHYVPFNRAVSVDEYVKQMEEVIDAAAVLGLDTVCTLAGFPAEGKNKMQTITEDLPGIFAPLAKRAADKGLKIAFENWFQTNLQHLGHFRALVEAVPDANVGFNFDPSHLHWQQIDYLASIEEFKDRIFHTHAKDVAIRKHVRDSIGVLEGGWWRYVIPGFGEIDWGRYILALRENGFDGVLSVEHEDRAFDAKKGFEAALRHLSQFV